MAKSSKLGGVLFTLICVGAVGYGGWYYWQSRAPKDPIYQTTTVGTATIKQTVTATGDLAMLKQIDVGSLVSGKVLEVHKDFNDVVKKDDLLVLIDDVTFKQKVAQAENSLKTAELNAKNNTADAKRTLALYAIGSANEQEKERAEASLLSAEISVANARLTLENARTDLERCSVRSPIDGVVMSRLIDPGKSVNASQSVANLFIIVSSYKEMKIEALVSEADIGLVKADLPVEFTVDAFPTRTFRAKVKQVRNSARASSGVVSYPVLIEVDNADEVLKPGMSASVAVVIANRENVPAIPNGALRARIPTDYKGEVRPAAGAAGAATAPGATAAAATPPTGPLPEGARAGRGQGGQGGEFAQGGGRGQGGGAAGGRGGGGGRGGRGAGLGNIGEGMNVVANQNRQVYRLIEENGKKVIEQVNVRIGIADTLNTELLPGSALNPGDKLVTFISMPGAAPILTQAPQNANAFGNQGGRGGQMMPGGGGGGARGGGGGGGGRG